VESRLGDLYKLLIVGMGNQLMSDDGLGIVALNELRRMFNQKDICCLDAGTTVLNYITEIGRAETLMAIDAITVGNQPGTIYRICLDDKYMADSRCFVLDGHVAGIIEAVALSKELTGLPYRAFIYGIEPHIISEGFSISDRVKKSLKRLLGIVQQDVDLILCRN